MTRIPFKNPKGGTIYWAKVGFDWGAFWSALILGGLPFFLRKMYAMGAYCIGLSVVTSITLISSSIDFSIKSENDTLLEDLLSLFDILSIALIPLGISIYLGMRGGKITARHYIEEGYLFDTKDSSLLSLAKNKWSLK